MTHPNQAPKTETLTPEQFLVELASVEECFPLVGGIMGARGETYDVEIAGYHAPMHDFFDDQKLREHARGGAESPTVRLPLEISPDFRYAFDGGEEWFRIGRGAFLYAAGRKVPIRVVRIYFEDSSAFWLYRDARDVKPAIS